MTFSWGFGIIPTVIKMEQESTQQFTAAIRDFRLPRYQEIPNVGLYLEQASKYIGEYLSPLGDFSLTSSMISNYVKKGLIPNPVKKQYGRDQVAYLFFIAVAKSVLSLDALSVFLRLQQRTYPLQRAYDYFCDEFENVLQFTFEIKDCIELRGEDSSDEKRLLYTCIVAAVQKIYLEKCLKDLSHSESEAS